MPCAAGIGRGLHACDPGGLRARLLRRRGPPRRRHRPAARPPRPQAAGRLKNQPAERAARGRTARRALPPMRRTRWQEPAPGRPGLARAARASGWRRRGPPLPPLRAACRVPACASLGACPAAKPSPASASDDRQPGRAGSRSRFAAAGLNRPPPSPLAGPARLAARVTGCPGAQAPQGPQGDCLAGWRRYSWPISVRAKP